MNRPSFYTRITDHLRDGGVVQVTTYTKSTLYEPKHLGLFRAPGSRHMGAYVRRGIDWLLMVTWATLMALAFAGAAEWL